jgi:sigma-E factor negative regulatory protein RseC
MITNTVRVIATSNGIASIAPTSKSGCGGCQHNSACAISGLGKYISFNRKPVELPCSANVRAGDELLVTMSETDFLKTGLLVYLLPALLAVLGATVAASLGFDDAGGAIAAVCGFAGGLLATRLLAWAPEISIQPTGTQFNQGDRA